MSRSQDRRAVAGATSRPATAWHDSRVSTARAPATTTDPGQRLVVDRIRCDGFGMCAELLPEVIELDDWGYPIVAVGAVPNELLEHARRAVAVCPVLALRLAPVPRATMPATPATAAMGARWGG